MSYNWDSRKFTRELGKETPVVALSLTWKKEDISELESQVVSAITCLNDCRISIGWDKPCNQGQVD